MYKLNNFFSWTLPYRGFKAVTDLTGNEQMKKKLKILSLIDGRISSLIVAFKFFIDRQWIYDCYKSQRLIQKINPEDKQIFNFDLSKLSWQEFIHNFAFGMMNFLVPNGDPDPKFEKNNYVLTIRNEYFQDFNWAFYHGKPMHVLSPKSMEKYLLNCDEVLLTMKDVAHKEANEKLSEKKAYQLQMKRASEIIERMQSNMNI